MKTRFLILIIAVFASLASVTAQEIEDSAIPIQDGKILFADTISVDGTSDEIYGKISKWISLHLSTRKGSIVENDKINKEITFKVSDYMEMEKKTFSIFSIYKTSIVRISYKDEQSVIQVSGIRYIEPEEMEKETPYIINGEDMLLKMNYKVVFVADAAEKVKEHSIKDIKDLFRSFREALK